MHNHLLCEKKRLPLVGKWDIMLTYLINTMEDTTIRQLAEKIAKDFALSVKQRTDLLLELDANQYTNLGIDSTKTEKTKVKADSKYIYKNIKGIDEVTGKMLLNHMDA